MIHQPDMLYPIIYTEKEDITIHFFTSLFGFKTVYLDESLTVLQGASDQKHYVGIASSLESILDEPIRPQNAAGSVLNMYVNNLNLAYQELLWNGAEIVQDIRKAQCGSNFMAVRDPNGIILLVTEYNRTSKKKKLQKRKMALV